jgi:hypothetical protein
MLLPFPFVRFNAALPDQGLLGELHIPHLIFRLQQTQPPIVCMCEIEACSYGHSE